MRTCFVHYKAIFIYIYIYIFFNVWDNQCSKQLVDSLPFMYLIYSTILNSRLTNLCKVSKLNLCIKLVNQSGLCSDGYIYFGRNSVILALSFGV